MMEFPLFSENTSFPNKRKIYVNHCFPDKLKIHEHHVIFTISHLKNPPNMTRFHSLFRPRAQNLAFFTENHICTKFLHIHQIPPQRWLSRANPTFCALARFGGTLRQPLKNLRKPIPFRARNRPGCPSGPKTALFGEIHSYCGNHQKAQQWRNSTKC